VPDPQQQQSPSQQPPPIDFSSIGGRSVTAAPIDFSSIGGKPISASAQRSSQTAVAPPADTAAPETGIWAGVKRNTVGMVSGLYHALTDPATDQEKAELKQKVDEANAKGDRVPEDLATNPSRATLAYHRLIDAPADQLKKKSGDELAAAKDLLSKGDTWNGANMYASAATDRGLAAIPMFGPWLNGVAQRYESGDKSGAATDVASAVLMSKSPSIAKGGAEAVGDVKTAIDKVGMTPQGELTPTAKTVSQVAGGLVGAAPGVAHGNIPAMIAGGTAGYKMGPLLAEHLLSPPATYPGASLPLADEFYQARAADLMKREAAQRVLDARAARDAKTAAAATPSPIVEPSAPVPESEGRPATWKNSKVAELSGQGGPLTRPAAVQAQLRQLNVPNVNLIADPNATMTPSVGTPKSVTRFNTTGQPVLSDLSGSASAQEYLNSLGRNAPGVEIRGGNGPVSNASGESSASMEAQSRLANEKAKGIQRVKIDTRSGKETPLIGTDAVDAKPGPYDEIITRDADGNETTLDRGPRATSRRSKP